MEDDWKAQFAADEASIERLLAQGQESGSGIDFNLEGDIDQSGKADDAQDFEDISDDDLPDEEDATAPAKTKDERDGDDFAMDDQDVDDLFGGDPSQEPLFGDDDGEDGDGDVDDEALFGPDPDVEMDAEGQNASVPTAQSTDHVEAKLEANIETSEEAENIFPTDPTDAHTRLEPRDWSDAGSHVVHDDAASTHSRDADMLDTDALFDDDEASLAHRDNNQDPNIPPAIESAEDLIKRKWPMFEPGILLDWNKLLPPRQAKWLEKRPLKKPKSLTMTKLSLEIAPDQERLFRRPTPAPSSQQASRKLFDLTDGPYLVRLPPHLPGQTQSADGLTNMAQDDDESSDELVGGYSLDDIATVCLDFAQIVDEVEQQHEAEQARLALEEAQSRKRKAAQAAGNGPVAETEADEWDAMFGEEATRDGVNGSMETSLEHTTQQQQHSTPPRKKPRLIQGLPPISQYIAPSFDNFLELTKQAASRVELRLDDPHLHLEDTRCLEQDKKTRRDQRLVKRMANGNMGRDALSRFNISNDEAYELLKESHKHKVRATLGNITVEHSMPALRLAWPYYRMKLVEKPDEFHRPPFRAKKFAQQTIYFHKLDTVKKRHTRGNVADVFRETKDLTLRDNSTAVLLEYCERIPNVLSKFGMGNRIINYYRKKDNSEEQAPIKPEIGDVHVLLPEDRSPFSIFGTVDPGETVPAIHNQMYRAPLFKHKPRKGDFILGRSTTGIRGPKWYIRNISHLFVVGQVFPLVEVPGPHSRKVTQASKNRLKMLSYRLMRKDPNHVVNLADITKHVADSTDAQNRQKLKEFLSYAKTEKGQWKLREGEVLMEEEQIRAMIKPEDTCMMDSMTLGLKMLEDAGFDPRNAVIEEDEGAAAGGGASDDEEEDGRKAGGKKGQQEKAEEALANKMAPWKTSKAFLDACAGKAMLQLHGEGDPTGHGLGFSFIRTSMKGGYLEAVQGPLATSADAIEKQKRENNGHIYSVKRQEAMYREGIREIWEKQKSTLSDGTLHDDHDVLHTADEDERFGGPSATTTTTKASSGGGGGDDGGTSVVSGWTSASRQNRQHRRLRIVRTVDRGDGQGYVEEEELIDDPVVIAQYIKRRDEVLEASAADGGALLALTNMADGDWDALKLKQAEEELARLKKNRERRMMRKKQKAILRGEDPSAFPLSPAGLHDLYTTPGTPATPGAVDTGTGTGPNNNNKTDGKPEKPEKPDKPVGTTRKCANCGQVGHIKTNKKLCPLLNGTIKPAEASGGGGFGGFGSSAPTAATAGGAAGTAAGSAAPPGTAGSPPVSVMSPPAMHSFGF